LPTTEKNESWRTRDFDSHRQLPQEGIRLGRRWRVNRPRALGSTTCSA
jgi:hypothetical protein